MNPLEQAFNAYMNLASAQLRPQQVKASNLFSFELIRSRSIQLRHLVIEIEMSSEFRELAQQTLLVSPCEDTENAETSRGIEIGTFFRRSRCYTSIYNDETVDPDTALRDLIAQLRKDEIQTRYLVPLQSVGFSNDVIEFKDFEIRRFSAEELDEILQNDVNEIFYETSCVDVSEIEGYWFIDVKLVETPLTVCASVDDEGRIWVSEPARHINDLESLSVTDESTAFPGAVARALDPLILYDWDSVQNMYSFRGVSLEIPFILKTNNDLLSRPHSAPEIPPFQVGPFFFDGTEDLSPPDYYIFIDGAESDSFHAFVTQMNSILERLKSAESDWNFLEIALLFFRRAFFTPGLQQLLWHITVIEALVGEDVQGLTSLLGRRLALILGKETKKSFQEVYDLRSTLVHGNEKLLDQKAKENHLHVARKLARQILVWFLHYLDHVLDKTSINDRTEIGLPTREDLLAGLDIKIESRERIRHLLRILPPDFPRTSDWLDQ